MTATEFEHIVFQLRPQMLRVAIDFFHNEEDAEDAVQDVLLKMWKREWKADDDITALAIRATKNQCVSLARKKKLRQHLALEETADNSLSTLETDQTILTQEQHLKIEQAISTLTHSEQRLVRLKQEEGLETSEIAVITGMNLNSVRSMLSAARRKLIKILSL